MKRTALFFYLFVFVAENLLSQQSNFPKLMGPYLGQKFPGMTPEIFAPGIVSTESHEFSCCFSTDGNEFYFTRRHPELNYPVIMVSKVVKGVWTEPEIAPFVDKQFSFEPSITPDNKRLYFQSGKPMPGQPGPPMNVLYVEREGGGWGEAKDPGPPFNPAKTMYISFTAEGTIYTTDISGGMGSECLAMIKKVDGKYLSVEKLGPPLNKEPQSMYPWVPTDGSYIIFSVRRPAQTPSSFLLISFKNEDGTWSEPREINLGMDSGQAHVSNDGKYLFFSGGERGKGDIYWVDAKIIEQLRPKK